MARARNDMDRESLARAATLVAVCTLVLTAAFVGLVALVSARAVGVVDRLPLYVLGMATAFVGTILLFEERGADGETILTVAATVALSSFLLSTLGGEGVIHVLRHPGEVIASQLLFYFLAAGMIGTGLGYWGLRHWREVQSIRRRRSFRSGL